VTGTRAFLRTPIAITLIALALAVRAMIPAGWMPAASGGFAVTLCTGGMVSTAWVDGEGRIHKEKPGESNSTEHCAFAGMAQAMLGGDVPVVALPVATAIAEPRSRLSAVSIGRGLAAPPPPSTGPPATL
jgi:hypothetical protein